MVIFSVLALEINKRRNPQIIIKFSLALADILAMVGVLILSVIEMLDFPTYHIRVKDYFEGCVVVDNIYCANVVVGNHVYNFIYNYSIGSSIPVSFYHISLMALNKLLAISFPLKYKKYTNKRKVSVCLCVGLWAFFTIWQAACAHFEYFYQFASVSSFRILHQLSYYVLLVIPAMITFLSTMALCVVFYRYKVKRKILLERSRNGHQIILGTMNNQRIDQMSPDSARFIKMVVLIVLGYGVTCVPYIIYEYVIYESQNAFVGSMSSGRYLFTLFYLNSLVDVVVYSGFDSNFKQSIKRLFPSKCKEFSIGRSESRVDRQDTNTGSCTDSLVNVTPSATFI